MQNWVNKSMDWSFQSVTIVWEYRKCSNFTNFTHNWDAMLIEFVSQSNDNTNERRYDQVVQTQYESISTSNQAGEWEFWVSLDPSRASQFFCVIALASNFYRLICEWYWQVVTFLIFRITWNECKKCVWIDCFPFDYLVYMPANDLNNKQLSSNRSWAGRRKIL